MRLRNALEHIQRRLARRKFLLSFYFMYLHQRWISADFTSLGSNQINIENHMNDVFPLDPTNAWLKYIYYLK